MKKGKILHYSSENGTGTIICEDNETIEFDVKNWKNYNVLPIVGLEVQINNDEITTVDIKSDNNEENKLAKLIEKKDKYLNSSVSNGWALINNSDNAFTLTYATPFSILGFLFYILIVSIILWPLFSAYAVMLAIVIYYFKDKYNKKTIIKGELDKEKLEFNVYKNGKIYKIITPEKTIVYDTRNFLEKNMKFFLIVLSIIMFVIIVIYLIYFNFYI
jgi:hypothetical protein